MSELNYSGVRSTWAEASFVGGGIILREISVPLSGLVKCRFFNGFIVSVYRESSDCTPGWKISIVIVTKYSDMFSDIKTRHFWISSKVKIISWDVDGVVLALFQCLNFSYWITFAIVTKCFAYFCGFRSSKSFNLNLKSQKAKYFIITPPRLPICSVSCISNWWWQLVFSLLYITFHNVGLSVFFPSNSSIIKNENDRLNTFLWSYKILRKIRLVIGDVNILCKSKV